MNPFNNHARINEAGELTPAFTGRICQSALFIRLRNKYEWP
ncbi:hypothetical protein [Desulfobacula sp.]